MNSEECMHVGSTNKMYSKLYCKIQTCLTTTVDVYIEWNFRNIFRIILAYYNENLLMWLDKALKVCIVSTVNSVFLPFRNIWDGSIVVERVFKSSNREVVAVSVNASFLWNVI